MNIIEAARALKKGKKVRDPMGFTVGRGDSRDGDGTGNLLFLYLSRSKTHDEEPARMYLSDLLSRKWTVVEEEEDE